MQPDCEGGLLPGGQTKACTRGGASPRVTGTNVAMTTPVHFDIDAILNEAAAAAAWMRTASFDPAVKAQYDMLSDAVMWRDEFPAWREDRSTLVIRLLFRHRTCKMLGVATRFDALWNEGIRLFPDWPGFRPERTARTAELEPILARCGLSPL